MTAVPVRDGSIAASFGSADWSLSAHGRVGDGEFHPYPARYIPALPRQIMSLLGVADGLVLDPFCGSGTSGMVALKHGRRFVGIDLNATYLDLALRTRLSQGALIEEAS